MKVAGCGTPSGYRRHRREHEDACEACLTAAAAAQREWQKQAKGGTPDRRVRNEWGFESFPSEEAARAYVRRFQTLYGRTWHIWRLPDGTFDFTSSSQPRRGMEELAEVAGTQRPDPSSAALLSKRQTEDR